jgi:hypothetical protein
LTICHHLSYLDILTIMCHSTSIQIFGQPEVSKWIGPTILSMIIFCATLPVGIVNYRLAKSNNDYAAVYNPTISTSFTNTTLLMDGLVVTSVEKIYDSCLNSYDHLDPDCDNVYPPTLGLCTAKSSSNGYDIEYTICNIVGYIDTVEYKTYYLVDGVRYNYRDVFDTCVYTDLNCVWSRSSTVYYNITDRTQAVMSLDSLVVAIKIEFDVFMIIGIVSGIVSGLLIGMVLSMIPKWPGRLFGRGHLDRMVQLEMTSNRNQANIV